MAAGRGGIFRIDAARKEPLELRIDARAPQAALDQGVDAEGRQVPLVEHDRMPERDRPLVIRVGAHEVEQLPRPLAVQLIPGAEGVSIHAGPHARTTSGESPRWQVN